MMCPVWACTVMLQDHTSQRMSRSLPANSLMQSLQCGIVGGHTDCCALRNEVKVGDSFCIPQYRSHNFSSRLTHSEIFCTWKSWVFLCHSSLVWGVKWCTRLSLPIITDSRKSFPSSLNSRRCENLKMLIFVLSQQTSWFPEWNTLRHPCSSWTILCTVQMVNSNAANKSRIVT
jgi:hypothetical protein